MHKKEILNNTLIELSNSIGNNGDKIGECLSITQEKLNDVVSSDNCQYFRLLANVIDYLVENKAINKDSSVKEVLEQIREMTEDREIIIL